MALAKMSGELAQINNTTILAQYGPMRLTIQAWGRGGPDIDLAAEAGRFSFTLLPRLTPARELFQRGMAWRTDYEEPLLNSMAYAAAATGQPDLGPMAAVAGVVADSVMEFLKTAGATKAIVENGGDLAVCLAPGATATVGVRLGLSDPEPAYKLVLSGDRRSDWGVCSSGLGGRGMTQGIADTALCVAASAAIADAAATALGNAVNVDSPAVTRVLAEKLHPDTDIKGLWVTESVGDLTRIERAAALMNGLKYAQHLADKGILLGGLVGLGGQVLTTHGFESNVARLQEMRRE